MIELTLHSVTITHMKTQLQTISDWLGSGSINIFGRPFSGKDTQSILLADKLSGVMVSGGELLRSHHDLAKIEAVLNSGDIVPSDFYLNLIVPYLSQESLRTKPLILNSVGRSHGEEDSIISATVTSNHPMRAVISLEISEDEVWKRFAAAEAIGDRNERADDTRQALITRLAKYNARTVPVLDYYREHGLLISVDGVLSRDSVTAEILINLVKRAQS